MKVNIFSCFRNKFCSAVKVVQSVTKKEREKGRKKERKKERKEERKREREKESKKEREKERKKRRKSEGVRDTVYSERGREAERMLESVSVW